MKLCAQLQKWLVRYPKGKRKEEEKHRAMESSKIARGPDAQILPTHPKECTYYEVLPWHQPHTETSFCTSSTLVPQSTQISAGPCQRAKYLTFQQSLQSQGSWPSVQRQPGNSVLPLYFGWSKRFSTHFEHKIRRPSPRYSAGPMQYFRATEVAC